MRQSKISSLWGPTGSTVWTSNLDGLGQPPSSHLVTWLASESHLGCRGLYGYIIATHHLWSIYIHFRSSDTCPSTLANLGYDSMYCKQKYAISFLKLRFGAGNGNTSHLQTVFTICLIPFRKQKVLTGLPEFPYLIWDSQVPTPWKAWGLWASNNFVPGIGHSNSGVVDSIGFDGHPSNIFQWKLKLMIRTS